MVTKHYEAEGGKFCDPEDFAHLHGPMMSNNPLEGKVAFCWNVMTVVEKGVHLCVNADLKAVLQDPGPGHGCDYGYQTMISITSACDKTMHCN